MFASLRGKIIEKKLQSVIIEVAGIGYEVFLLPEAKAKIKEGKEVFLYIYHYMREDAEDLYGFLEKEQLEFFSLLNEVAGIGPKTALGILGVATIDILKEAITNEDESVLTKVSGIGKKTAGRIVLELKNKISVPADFGRAFGGKEKEALEALMSLGYSLQDAREILKEKPKELKETKEIVHWALKKLGK